LSTTGTLDGKAAIGKIAFSGREHVVAITPAGAADGRGMMAYTLRYRGELRDQRDYFRDIKAADINPDSLELAEALIDKRAAPFDLDNFQDGYEVAVKELVNAKINHLPVPKDEVPATRPANIVNLMDALRKSLGENGTKSVPKKPVVSEKSVARKGIGLVKATTKRKSA
jgi:DNA end-binding protein Ku